jgi:hypothetical protein
LGPRLEESPHKEEKKNHGKNLNCCGDSSHKPKERGVVLPWNIVKSRKNTKQQKFGRRREGMGLKSLVYSSCT